MAHPIIQLNTLDDRREIHELLRRLSPERRVRFLERACAAATLPNSWQQPRVARDTYEFADRARWDSAADTQLTVDCYMMLWGLARDYDFSLDKALALLVRFAKGKTDS